MSEHKRTSLTTIGTNKRDKKHKQQSKTLRFILSLPEPNEEACPEFNYTELLKSAEKKAKASGESEGGELNGLDPLAEDDDEQVRQIARHFEAKYGGSSRKKQSRYEDYVDVGAGYDETDPFIDNTDAYDEVVPEEMTTAHGGFYINCGPLEFRKVADYSDGEDDLKDSRPKKVKRTLSAGEGNDSDGKSNYANCSKKAKFDGEEVNRSDVVKKKTVTLEENEVHRKKRKKQHMNADELHRKKAATVKELLKEKRDFMDVDNIPQGAESIEPKKSIPNSEPDKRVNSSITDVIESVVNAAHANEDSNKESESSVTKSTPESIASDSDNSHDGQGYEANERESGEVRDDAKLPDNLSEELQELIEALKKAAKTSAEGKCKFFSCTVNNVLLRVEKACQDLPTNIRQNVYAHLGVHLPCTKDTLMKRAKKLFLEHEEAKIRKPLSKLKAAIDAAMPAVLENYTRACQKAMEEKSVEDSNGDGEGAEAKKDSARSKVPKRKFPWTEEIRTLLRQVVQQKIQCLAVLRPRRELPRDVLINFLEKDIRVLWPPGWMKVATLLHHCQDVLAYPVSRTKRAAQLLKKVAPAVCTSAASVPPPPQIITSIPISRQTTLPQVNTHAGVSILKPVSVLQGQTVATTINNIGSRIATPTFTSPTISNSTMSSASFSGTPSVNPTKSLKASISVSSSVTISTPSRHSNSGSPLVHTQSASVIARPTVKNSMPVVSTSVQMTTVTSSVSVSKPIKNVTPVVSSHSASVTSVVNSSKNIKNTPPSLPVLSQLSASVSITPTISRTKSATPLAPSTMASSASVILNKTLYGDVTITKASNSNAEKMIDKPLLLGSSANPKPKRSSSPVTLDLSPNRRNRTPSPIVSAGNPSKTKGVVDLSVNKTSPPSVSKSSSPSLPLNIPDCISVLPSTQSNPSASTSPALTVTPKSHVSLKQRILQDSAAEASGGTDENDVKVIDVRTGPKGLDTNLKNSSAKHRSKRVEHTAVTKTECNSINDGLRPNVVYSSSSLKEDPPIFEKEAEIQYSEEQETETATDILSQLINESLTGGTSREQVVESPQTCGSSHGNDGAEELVAARSDSHDPPQPADTEKSVQLEMARVMEKLMELQNATGDATIEVTGLPDSALAMAAAQQAKREGKHSHPKHKEGSGSSKRQNAASRHASWGGFQEEFQKHVMKCEEENSLYDSATLPSSTVGAHNGNSKVNNQSISDENEQSKYTSSSGMQKSVPAVIPCNDMAYAWPGSGDVDPLTGFHFLGQLLFDKSAAAHTSSHTGSSQHSSP